MPLIDSVYTNPDMIEALYQDPANEILLAEYILSTGAQQYGFAPSGGLAALSSMAVDPGLTGIGGGKCFGGECVIALFNRKQVSLEEIYANSGLYVGKGVLSFAKRGFVAPGRISAVSRVEVKSCLAVCFGHEQTPMRMIPTHRFFTSHGRYRQMRGLKKHSFVKTYTNRWGHIEIRQRKTVRLDEPEWFYNLSVDLWGNYFVTVPGGKPKAVSNSKPEEVEGGA